MQRSFGLDLARAAAITSVLFAHYLTVGKAFYFNQPLSSWEESVATFGFFGVELFFALSGFLIGRILINALERSPTIDTWMRFMVRRWLRTIPLYVLWLLIILIFLKPPSGMRFEYAIRYITFTQSLISPMLPAPWGGWFAHSWSLTVEEWFYLLFSCTAFLIASVSKSRAIQIACSIFIVVPVLLRFHYDASIVNWPTVDELIRKVTVFRFDAIAYGVVAALLLHKHSWLLKYSVVLSAVSAILLSLSFHFLWTPHLTTALVYSLPAIAFSLMMPAASAWMNAPRLPTTIVRWLSTRSYALYLFHFSVLEIFWKLKIKFGIGPWPLLIASAALTLILADLSFRFFESPILARRPSQYRPEKENPSVAPEPELQALNRPN